MNHVTVPAKLAWHDNFRHAASEQALGQPYLRFAFNFASSQLLRDVK